jgi:hypothetical protein
MTTKFSMHNALGFWVNYKKKKNSSKIWDTKQTYFNYVPNNCATGLGANLTVRASPVVGAPQAEIRRYLVPDGCKIRPREVHFSSGEPREKNEYIRIQT